MSKRVLVSILGLAALVRIIFIIGSASGQFAYADTQRHTTYLLKGYGIATGYGFVEVRGKGEVRRHLQTVRRAIEAGEAPEMGDAAKARTGIHFPLTMDHPPGIYLTIAGLYKLFDGPANLPLSILGGVLDVFSTWLLMWIVATTLGARMGMVTGALYAIYPPIVFSAIAKEPDGILPFFLLAMFACVIQGTRSRAANAWAFDVAAGCLLGLGSYFRPDFLPTPMVMALFLAMWTRRPMRSLGRMAIVQACALLVLLPWAIRNHDLSGKWIFTSSSMGGVLINGLGSFDNPWGFGYDDTARWNEALAAGLPGPFTPEGDEHFRAIFWESLASNPGAYVESVLRRLPIAIATPYEVGYQRPDSGTTFAQLRAEGIDRYEALMTRPMLVLGVYGIPISMAVLSGLSLACCVFMLIKERQRFGLICLLFSLHAYNLASHTLLQIHPRYLVTTVFCWLIGLAYVIVLLAWRGEDPIDALDLHEVPAASAS